MLTTAIILTLSEKWGKKCIAAFDTSSECLIRMVSDASSGDGIENNFVNNIQLLDEVCFKITHNCPLEHQTENVLIDLAYGIRQTGREADIRLLNNLSHGMNNIFGDTNYKLNDATQLTHSLEIVRFSDMTFSNSVNHNGRPTTKVSFYSNGRYYNNYSMTDHEYFGYNQNIASGFIVISLPPSDSFTEQWGFFKYVSAIYPE